MGRCQNPERAGVQRVAAHASQSCKPTHAATAGAPSLTVPGASRILPVPLTLRRAWAARAQRTPRHMGDDGMEGGSFGLTLANRAVILGAIKASYLIEQ